MRRLLPLLLLAPALTGLPNAGSGAETLCAGPGCANGGKPNPRFPRRRPGAGAGVSRPARVDRADAGPNEVKAVDGERWAERLPLTLARGVADNLTRALGRPVPLTPADRPGAAPDCNYS